MKASLVMLFCGQETLLWRGSLLPLGCEAALSFCGRCATEREQAPSPQGFALPGLPWDKTHPHLQPALLPVVQGDLRQVRTADFADDRQSQP
ncbi:hypothetical protein SRABI06_05040 [Pseudomonas brassicacearum]|nr:hypothetical protein SRABI06_05040 [Pseudomonas brassicacearum]